MDIPAVPHGLESIMHELVFSQWDPSFLETPAARRAVDDVVFGRFHSALRYSIPWMAAVIDMRASTVVEVGCGSGSSTAALAMNCAGVVGIDIDEPSVAAARARCDAYNLDNVTLVSVSPAEMLASAVNVEGADVFVLYAVLEHQTYHERLETLRTLWSRLPPGGHLVIIETPNRLTYDDHHTSEMPFFHMLPDDVAFAYLDRVPRVAFRDTMAVVLRDHPDEAWERRIRWGLGASYHEFELALDEPLDEIIVADGFEQQMVDFFPIGLDEELLTRFFVERVDGVPIGFSRAVLNLILRKPRSDADRAAARRRAVERRAGVAARIAPQPAIASDGSSQAAESPAVETVDSRTAPRASLVYRTYRVARRTAGRVKRAILRRF